MANDPDWLADVLSVEGLDVVEYPGWHDRGHGDFGDIWGVVCHHTGSNTDSPETIADGRPDLPGPLSHILLAQDGTVTVVAQGIAWHAGRGQHDGLPDNQANEHTIGIHAVSDGQHDYPDVQYEAYVRCAAAIVRKLGQPASHVIGHKEWSPEKVDPALDMDKFRSDVEAHLSAASAIDVKGR
jgi:N-acetyl-anhydromuramyl-L-alanine amidase AmpD